MIDVDAGLPSKMIWTSSSLQHGEICRCSSIVFSATGFYLTGERLTQVSQRYGNDPYGSNSNQQASGLRFGEGMLEISCVYRNVRRRLRDRDNDDV